MSNRINLQSTFLLIFVLLLMMLAGGSASAYVGYLMGKEALKVVTQPDTNSQEPVAKTKRRVGSHKGLSIIEEREVLVNVYDHIYNQTKKEQEKKSQQSFSQSKSSLVTNKEDQDNVPAGFVPIKNSSGGVTIEVSQAKFQGSSLILGVKLKNESSDSVRFLYSFMDIKDDQNRSLSAITEGLPGELPANGKEFQGNLIVPLSLLNNSRNISLTLKDYPEQELELKLEKISVTR
ncbi:hypothetical protein Xen7305DRAFT_00031040 [Xenococcus sp. PCC 7305]|uniref:hypothetical protein n=1 Tax=Xenococcus sp. PCC 7305 TaxID=102125 RepID=UPI0002AC37E5|nr:hypothetical protein [Xenococcus sp. PCC 7305]ELS03382.1 hypothetical protein Xen7305DRAFT_00031040 [Xenococcus sp. PCC 7305]